MRTAVIGLVMIVIVAAAALALAAFLAPLQTVNWLLPGHRGTVRVGRDIAYGPDPRQKLDIYAPRANARLLPVIVFFYGGSWVGGRRQDYGWAARALAAQGFVVVLPDYRLVPQVRFPAFVEDCAGAVRWARAHVSRYGGDGERIVLMGHSAGAYNAAMLALDPRWLGGDRQAVRGFVGLAGPYDFLPFDQQATRDAFGAWPKPEETQPITFASADDPPALLLHGAADTTVAPRNSERLGEKLAAAGGQAEVKLYPGVDHPGIVAALARMLQGRAPVLADAAAFARRVTAPRAGLAFHAPDRSITGSGRNP